MVSAALAAGTFRGTEVLTHRLAALGEAAVERFEPEAAVRHESPFLAQANQVVSVIEGRRPHRLYTLSPGHHEALDARDDEHARVLLSQCRDAVVRISRRAPRTGATLDMNYEVERIVDIIERLRLLLDATREDASAWVARAKLIRTLLLARQHADHIRPVLGRASRLMGREIGARSGEVGEHYIARTPREYAEIWRAAGGAGFVIAILAAIKVGLHEVPLIEALMFSANYAFGFIFVQLVGFVIATKQPPMTAAALVGAMSMSSASKRNREVIITLQQLIRSQVAAIFGNVVFAFPVALGLSVIAEHSFGAPIAPRGYADHLLHDLDPLDSGAIIHAAIAGVWLSLSGLVGSYAASSTTAQRFP